MEHNLLCKKANWKIKLELGDIALGLLHRVIYLLIFSFYHVVANMVDAAVPRHNKLIKRGREKAGLSQP